MVKVYFKSIQNNIFLVKMVQVLKDITDNGGGGGGLFQYGGSKEGRKET